MNAAAVRTHLQRLATLVLLAFVALQLTFAARIGLMTVVDPQSTTFQRSEAWRLLTTHGRILWSQSWRDESLISGHLKRAVIASEDAGFVEHSGVQWDALEQAWERNQRAQEQALRQPQRREGAPANARIVGGSTVTQQLAKNLFLSGERTVVRKAQELALALMLETMLSKRRILEIYLNSVEWGEGLFGAQAAARHYFGADAARLTPPQAARLAVMLPAPKRFEARPNSAYLQARAEVILGRMGSVSVP